jgi:cellulose biosynthesis protein BcsQ
MKIIATYSIKGGVGKTSTAVNLAFVAARQGHKVLVWDLDPQGAASFYFRVKPRIKSDKLGFLEGEVELDDVVKDTEFENLDILPADFAYRNLDLVFDEQKKPTSRLKKLLKSIRREYDFVFLDCPPNINLVSENVFEAADVLLVPLIPTTLSLRTFKQLIRFLRHADLSRVELLPFFSMVDRRKKLHTEMVESLPQRVPGFLRTHIPTTSEIERMGVVRAPIGAKGTTRATARLYEDLWREVHGRLASGVRAGVLSTHGDSSLTLAEEAQ